MFQHVEVCFQRMQAVVLRVPQALQECKTGFSLLKTGGQQNTPSYPVDLTSKSRETSSISVSTGGFLSTALAQE